MVINGAAAHRASTGDMIIVACFVQVDADEAANHEPSIVLVDGKNAIVDIKNS
jgi:aspartate 1-decarboxylase